jgi:hypothetical protein
MVVLTKMKTILNISDKSLEYLMTQEHIICIIAHFTSNYPNATATTPTKITMASPSEPSEWWKNGYQYTSYKSHKGFIVLAQRVRSGETALLAKAVPDVYASVPELQSFNLSNDNFTRSLRKHLAALRKEMGIQATPHTRGKRARVIEEEEDDVDDENEKGLSPSFAPTKGSGNPLIDFGDLADSDIKTMEQSMIRLIEQEEKDRQSRDRRIDTLAAEIRESREYDAMTRADRDKREEEFRRMVAIRASAKKKQRAEAQVPAAATAASAPVPAPEPAAAPEFAKVAATGGVFSMGSDKRSPPASADQGSSLFDGCEKLPPAVVNNAMGGNMRFDFGLNQNNPPYGFANPMNGSTAQSANGNAGVMFAGNTAQSDNGNGGFSFANLGGNAGNTAQSDNVNGGLTFANLGGNAAQSDSVSGGFSFSNLGGNAGNTTQSVDGNGGFSFANLGGNARNGAGNFGFASAGNNAQSVDGNGEFSFANVGGNTQSGTGNFGSAFGGNNARRGNGNAFSSFSFYKTGNNAQNNGNGMDES